MSCGECRWWQFVWIGARGDRVGECTAKIACLVNDDDGEPIRDRTLAADGVDCAAFSPTPTTHEA